MELLQGGAFREAHTSRYLCRRAVVILQQPAQSFPAVDGVSRCRHRRWHYGGYEDGVALTLVGAFLVNMCYGFGEHMLEGTLAKEDQP